MSRSLYVRMHDGTRLAVDVWTSVGTEPSVLRMPALLMLTRYWRAFDSQDKAITGETLATAEYFTAAGYAVVIADMRGTGASFGSRDTEFSDAEVRDYGDLIDWIAAQPWSNGRVATLGASYLGNSAEFAAIPNRPALKAVIPEFSDFSEYRDAVRPGGMENSVIGRAWMTMTAALDRDDGCTVFSPGAHCDAAAPWYFGVRPVDSDDGLQLLERAVSEHSANADLAPQVEHLVYSDDRFGRKPGDTLDTVSPSDRWRQIDQARVPALHWASWFDGGTAEGVLTRFINYRTPIDVIIGAWNHGGTSNANPYDKDVGRPLGSVILRDHLDQIRRFLEPLMQREPPHQPANLGSIRYFTVGANEWRTTRVWPPAGLRNDSWYLASGNALGSAPPTRCTDSDTYKVNFFASTGPHNRWHTQLGGDVNYGDRRAADRLLLTYTSEPVQYDTEVTGSPGVRIYLKSSAADGALIAYLEDVAPDGRVTYLTEGEIRLLFSGNGVAHPGFKTLGPLHTFMRAEAQPLHRGTVAMFWFALRPISVVLRRGHRVRLALSGADAGTFERIPATGEAPAWTILRDACHPSHIELPTRRWKQ